MAPTGQHTEAETAGDIRIVVNGEDQVLEAGATVATVVARLCPSPSGIAVARNREVVPRGTWPATPLAPGDRIEIVTAAAGG
ncbi:MAG TPA: sulfur carrier protein ThiS [Acidimicrobiales bacterium]|nr:sulfur carrier protein ThiS [Acidimicrobiales bacterium]